MAQKKKTCHCLIRHPSTPEEREAVKEALAYARKVGDTTGIAITVAQLSGRCPAQG